MLTSRAGSWTSSFAMKRTMLFVVIGLIWAGVHLACPSRSSAGDPNPVRAGLALWLDASAINEQRTSAGLEPLVSGVPLELWSDLSGNSRNLSQTSKDWQPDLHQLADAWLVRFDGDDDCLRYESDANALSEATIFLVAAPHHNPGTFSGLFAANEAGRRDYESGFNVDLGPNASARFNQVNVEGPGFRGAHNLRTAESDFSRLSVIEVRIEPAAERVELWIDGVREGSRPLKAAPMSIQQLTLGARFYTNDTGEQIARGHSFVDVAEVCVYDRVLDEGESKSVREYLSAKHAGLAEAIAANKPSRKQAGVPLVKVENPPAIQMLVPGFDFVELPLELTNVNNVQFRDDGKLVTLGYNGDVHLLSDTDADGLEDHAEIFYHNQGSLRGPIGIALTPPGYAKGRGLFVASKGKVTLIVDTDGDDRSDQEILVADGWDEITQNVDAVGMALDSDGNLFFGLGTANYANAFLIDEQGNAHYSLESDRGSVQKVSADFSRRETVCTGIRFPIAFAFNEHGDLFCTEQEGATWLANGNPFDELLHIQPGKHYGFPPRHPRHNPSVIDEPSTFDYGPQHQSTCGMVFNRQPDGSPAFGPAWWTGDAIVCGESRGKLWRTQLVKSAEGYVASSQLIACLQMLTVDTCVAPNGDLVVACHSGPPDWGTGPTGIGKLFRVRMTQPEAPRPIAAWTESAREVRIAFDRPLDPQSLRDLARKATIEFGAYVRPGDRFEHLVPPYEVVRKQLLAPRFELPVISGSVSQDLRTLILNTQPMTSRGEYAVTLEGLTGESEAAMDVGFSMHGIRAEWQPAAGSTLAPWSGWIPHLDLDVSRELLAQSSMHQELWERLDEPGILSLSTQVDLKDVLRPAVQPGAELDHSWPPEIATLTLSSPDSFEVVFSDDSISNMRSNLTQTVVSVESKPDPTGPIALTLRLETKLSTMASLHCSLSTNEDASQRPIPLRRFFVPWSPAKSTENADAIVAPVQIAELQGGSWGRGHRLFHSEQVGCAKCHVGDARGRSIGPDLRNLIHRDYTSVLRDLLDPSYAINPDHIGHLVALDDGRVLTGVLRTEDGKLVLGDDQGKSQVLDRDRIERMQPASVSVMPKGLLDKLDENQRRDLMTYLLIEPPHMPLDAPLDAPPIRTSAEVAAALAGAQPTPLETRPLNLVLVDGVKDHGPGEHDYPAWQRQWEQLFLADPSLTISTARDFPDDEQLRNADALIFFQKGRFDGVRETKLDQFLQRGGGAVYIHWAVNGDDRSADFAKRIGLASHGGNIKYRHGPLTLDIHSHDHPIVRNFSQLQLYDESYWKLTGDPGQVTLLATSEEDGEATPQMWATERNGGRIFVSIPGHYSWTFDDPLFRILLLRGIAWSTGEPVDRFNALVTPGARMSR